MGAPTFPGTTFRVRRVAEEFLDLVLLCGAYVMAFLPFVSGLAPRSNEARSRLCSRFS